MPAIPASLSHVCKSEAQFPIDALALPAKRPSTQQTRAHPRPLPPTIPVHRSRVQHGSSAGHDRSPYAGTQGRQGSLSKRAGPKVITLNRNVTLTRSENAWKPKKQQELDTSAAVYMYIYAIVSVCAAVATPSCDLSPVLSCSCSGWGGF
jgi:hypothetical protein